MRVRQFRHSLPYRADFACRVSVATSVERVRQIMAITGRAACRALLGVPALTMDHWLRGLQVPSKAARRAIFLVWFLLRYPGQVPVQFDIVTEGRFLPDCDPEATTGGSSSACGVPAKHTIG